MHSFHFSNRSFHGFLLAASLLALTACGGGSPPQAAAPTTTTTPTPTSKYIRVCLSGEDAGTGNCPAEPELGNGVKPTDWGCTRDTDTGLTWEVSIPRRISTGTNFLFTNYTRTDFYQTEITSLPDPNIPQTTSQAYVTAGDISEKSNALGYANSLNALPAINAVCGMKQWRIPHEDELIKLSITYLQGTYIQGLPLIAANLLLDPYFPGTANEPYLTSSFLAPNAGTGRDGEDLYTDNVWFRNGGLATLANPTTGSIYDRNKRKDTRALRLVADPCATCYAVPNNTGTRWLTQSTVLPNGKVLVTGGGGPNFAELYDPVAATWSLVQGLPNSGLPKERHSSTLLPNGTVLIVGGVDSSNTSMSKTWLFDPTTNLLLAGPNTATVHAGHTATTLANGKVVIAGGDCTFGSALCNSGSTEIYDVTANAFTSLAPMPIPVKHAAAALIGANKIFVAGGISGSVKSDAQVYDASTNSWRVLSTTLASPRLYHTATALQDGRVLVIGGYSAQAGSGGRWDSSDIYNPATDKISQGPSMQTKRFTHTATLLVDGRVLVTGGSGALNDDTSTKSVEYFDPKSNQWLESCELLQARGGHTAALLQDGSLLISGGIERALSVSNPLYSAQIWRR
jgi:hypothetical protein